MYPLFDAFLTILWIFLFVAWIWLLFIVIADMFRDPDLSGWAKALWVIALIVLPLFGVLGYLVFRGSGMQERSVRAQRAAEDQYRSYMQDLAGNGASTADQLEKLARLRDQGAISPEEYEREKSKVLSRT
ncbi:MAG TPA: SHOCT domain-containing protein [Acidimicrobiales bacterium]|nr:SHOCT domain-containing protein [Acidimicrobiales bacterium]